MSDVRRGWDMLTEKDRDRCVKEIVAYFLDERGETIGVIAAESVLDFFLQSAGTGVYNKAVEDVGALLKERLGGLEVEINLLKKQE